METKSFSIIKGNDWSSINGKTILYTVTDLSNAILGQSLSKGDRVGIILTILQNGRWLIMELFAQVA